MRKQSLTLLVAFAIAVLPGSTNSDTAAQPPRIWKKLRAQGYWSAEDRPSASPFLQLELSRARRARIRFALQPDDKNAVEAAGFTVLALRDSIAVLVKGSSLVSSSQKGTARDADSVEVRLFHSGTISYFASWNTSELIRRDGPWSTLPTTKGNAGTQGRAVLGKTAEPSFRLDSPGAMRARIRFTLQPDDQTTIECGDFTITTSRDGLRIATAGRVIVSSTAKARTTEADSLEVWLSPGGGAGYRTLGTVVTR